MNVVKYSENITNELFQFVEQEYPEVWRAMLRLVRPHSIRSVKFVFQQHLLHCDNISVFQNVERIPNFLLEFVRTVTRCILQPGTSYGLLLTCRVTKQNTQATLDGRHLKMNIDDEDTRKKDSQNIPKDLLKEIFLFTDVTHIFEISKTKTFFHILVKNYTDTELLNRFPDSCFIDFEKGDCFKGSNQFGHKIYYNLAQFIIIKAFTPGVYRILYKNRVHLESLLSHLNSDNIIAFSDVMYVYKKCGISSYFCNLINLLDHQFFKNAKHLTANDFDIVNIIKYQCFSGQPLPLNRNGLRKDPNKSGLERLCFEAVRQNLIEESVKGSQYRVEDSTSKIFFGQQFNEEI